MASASFTPDNTNPEDATNIPSPTVSNIKDFSAFPNLWYRIDVLIADLKSFNKPDSNKRLEKIVDPSFIGEHFVEEELNKRLDRRNKKRVESGDFRICAAHDLAPIMAQVLGIDLKQLEKDKRFANLVEEKGLPPGKRMLG
ncbi:hypothetical protein BDV27DRAFT_162877 [Aspergillus caelatus]|uniref:Uncharacterized protein n=1 Tax=Aspergillus caelatus TaxID=61420 RepID=A0A5N6ZQN8_9EURO|nr:uncharacterized protein BDV27DRAFT_162877 [Aspergillus caelatus]KAE8359189.1 hypothetical protein BDV27DRAFT_162877 [Aspergillus caelatus]